MNLTLYESVFRTLEGTPFEIGVLDKYYQIKSRASKGYYCLIQQSEFTIYELRDRINSFKSAADRNPHLELRTDYLALHQIMQPLLDRKEKINRLLEEL